MPMEKKLRMIREIYIKFERSHSKEQYTITGVY